MIGALCQHQYRAPSLVGLRNSGCNKFGALRIGGQMPEHILNSNILWRGQQLRMVNLTTLAPDIAAAIFDDMLPCNITSLGTDY